jgi:hypothetical protein
MTLWLAACAGTVSSTGPGDTVTAPDSSTDSPADTASASVDVESVGGLAVVFSHTRGRYDAPFELDLKCDAPDAEVRVTTDGTHPVNGEPWAGPLTVSGTTTVSAVPLLDGVPIDDPVTHTFLFLDQVADQQAPATWPTIWWGGYTADYAMDPELASDALVPALEALPVISLVVAPGDLWGPSGIYENPLSEGSDWEVPVSVEWLGLDDETWQVNAGLRIMGGASRDPASSPKKALRLLFKADYGPTSLSDVALPEQTIDTWDTLVLRARYNNSWIHWDTVQRSRGQYLRDQFARSSQHALGHPSVSGRYVHLFLDGLYWGLYNLHPRPQASFLARLYGGEDTDYDAVNSGEAIDGDLVAWEGLHLLVEAGISSDEAYQAVADLVELDNLIDYMLLNLYLGNDDWPSHNWYAGRGREGQVGWIFFAWDTEHTLKNLDADVIGADTKGSPARIYRRLLEHPDFVERVQDRAHQLLGEGGPLSAPVALARFEALAEAVAPAVRAESVRWGDYRRDVHSYSNGPYELYTVEAHWDTEHVRLTESYLPERTGVVIAQLRAVGLY